MRAGRAVIVAVLIAGALAAAPSVASAACPRGAQCATLTVPLDHTGQTAGTQSVAYAKLPATGARTGTLVLLSGGPGQAAIPLTTGFAELLEPLRASYDIVTVDQRGTGDSGAVECDVESVSECAERLGNRRAFMNTPETARDLEDLRAALGVEQLTLFGVSYGAKVASEYARRYPARTAAVILDSPAPGRRAGRRRRAARARQPARAQRGLLPGPVRADGDRRRRRARRGRRAAAGRRRARAARLEHRPRPDRARRGVRPVLGAGGQ